MAKREVTISVHPTSHDTVNIAYYSVSSSYPLSNGYTDSDSTTYGQVGFTRGANAETYVYYKFDFSSIPAGATIKSVSAKAKGVSSVTSSSIVATRQMQLATGTTLKGSALTMSASATEQTFSDVGTWTREELLDAGIRFYTKRKSSNTSTNYNLRMYGATMTVTYEIDEPDMPVRVKQNGAWATASKILVKQNGSWSEATKITAKDNGTWK